MCGVAYPHHLEILKVLLRNIVPMLRWVVAWYEQVKKAQKTNILKRFVLPLLYISLLINFVAKWVFFNSWLWCFNNQNIWIIINEIKIKTLKKTHQTLHGIIHDNVLCHAGEHVSSRAAVGSVDMWLYGIVPRCSESLDLWLAGWMSAITKPWSWLTNYN